MYDNMSNHKIEIDFTQLRYNLYDLLGLDQDATTRKIKKRYRKLVLEYHPDKTDDFDEDVFNHLTMANQILTNDSYREKYDYFLNGETDSFVSLKENAKRARESQEKLLKSRNKTINYIKPGEKPKEFDYNSNSSKSYKQIESEMNQKHGYSEDYSTISKGDMMKLMQKKQMDRSKLKIEQEEFRGKTDFNSKFDNRKKGKEMSQQIIEYKKNEMTTFQANRSNMNYVGIENMNSLYLEGESLQTDHYSTLDRAFGIYQNPDVKERGSIEEKMRNYEKETDNFSKMKPGNFTKKKWNEW